jgi:ssDNA-binding Zn-finger/Zn-ribbon topoisomerase 1
MVGNTQKTGSEANSAVNAVVKCPKCGGNTGYEFNKTIKHIYSGQWLEPASSLWEKEWCVNDALISMDKTVKCLDCGKRVSRKSLGI